MGCGVPEQRVHFGRFVAELDFRIAEPPVVDAPGHPGWEAIGSHDGFGGQQPQQGNLCETAIQNLVIRQ